jgi:hypothetical protein
VNPCNGELVHLTGDVVVQENRVASQDALDQGFFLHHELNGIIKETGVGLTTGATYTGRDNFHESFNSPSGPALQATFTSREKGLARSSEAGLSFTNNFFLHFVALPDGSFKFTRVVDPPFECKG